MLKARANRTLIVGLPEDNVKRLKQGKPIIFSAGEFGLPELAPYNLLIMYGVTEGAIKAELDAAIRP